jgi:hypothetical protein
MALAATLAAGGMRPASFLPAITCSDCGNEIEIAAMGEHVCDKTAALTTGTRLDNPYTLGPSANAPPTSPPKDPNYTTNATLPITRVRAPTIGADGPISKPMRPPPPRINPDAANVPFLAPQSSMSRSPISPALSIRSMGSNSSNGRKPVPLRSATSPMPRLFDPRPPSPELTGGYDCAFPPFYPGQPISRPGTSNGHRMPSGERTPSRGGFRLERPSTAQGGHNNGPRRPSNQALPPISTSMNGRQPSESRSAGPRDDPISRPATANSHRSQADGQRRNMPQRPGRTSQEVLSPTFMDAFSQEPASESNPSPSNSQPPVPLKTSDRSQTLPMHRGFGDKDGPRPGLSRSSTEPFPHEKRPPSSGAGSVASIDVFTHTNYQTGSFQNGSRLDRRLQNAPPVPKAVQEHRQESSHTASPSSSSNGSKDSYAGSSVGGPSPVTSAASSFDAFSPLREAPSSPYGDDQQMRVAGLTFKQPEKLSIQTEQKPQHVSLARPRLEASSPDTPPKIPAAVIRTPDESPIDPGFSGPVSHNQPWHTDPQLVQPIPLKIDTTSPRKAPSPPPAKPAQPPKYPSDLESNHALSPLPINEVLKTRAPPLPFPLPHREAQRPAPPIRRPTIPGLRPVCRGCNKTIEGKSVKAADGRLTGRWHKQCFTCRSCHQPFATADFYVIDNQPYCEHHYHEANGSLCAGCHCGIEGQYLETTSSAEMNGALPTDKKFHPRCFTCVDCRMVLAEDYFEIKGRVYCERHALAAMRSQPRMGGHPGGRSGYRGAGSPSNLGLSAPIDRRGLMAERRTTRLMVMN